MTQPPNDTDAGAVDLIGYTEAAHHLSAESGVDVSRQLVWQWWNRRESNGFPEGSVVISVAGGERRVFSRDAVTAWYLQHRERLGARWQRHDAC